MCYLFEFVAFSVIFATCAIHAHRFHENIPISKVFHLVWALLYAFVCVLMALYEKSWLLLACFAIERFVFYNQTLTIIRNLNSRIKLPFFYLHSKSEHGSSTDAILEKIGIAYPISWFLFLGLFIYLQTKL